jgi:hypothetical protein
MPVMVTRAVDVPLVAPGNDGGNNKERPRSYGVLKRFACETKQLHSTGQLTVDAWVVRNTPPTPVSFPGRSCRSSDKA